MVNQAQFEQVQSGKGFIAALDQSGGSTPKALGLYGISEDAYANDDEMFTLMHQMRSRIVNAPAFTGDKVVGAILFEMTMDRQIGGKPAAQSLCEDQGGDGRGGPGPDLPKVPQRGRLHRRPHLSGQGPRTPHRGAQSRGGAPCEGAQRPPVRAARL